MRLPLRRSTLLTFYELTAAAHSFYGGARARRHAAITLKASPILSNETPNEREGGEYFFHSSVLKHASVVCLMANELGTVCKQPSIVRGELTRRSDKEGGYDDDGQWKKEKLRFRNKPVHSLTHSLPLPLTSFFVAVHWSTGPPRS